MIIQIDHRAPNGDRDTSYVQADTREEALTLWHTVIPAPHVIERAHPWYENPGNLARVAESFLSRGDADQIPHLIEKAYNYDEEFAAVLAEDDEHLLTASPPCQSVSAAGQRDTR